MEEVFLNLRLKSNSEVENLKWLALGKAVSDEPLNETEFTNILRNYWNSSHVSSINAVATNTFTLSFVNEEDLTNAVEECPILVMGQCFIIQPWPIDKPLKSVSFNFVPFWVQIHNLPPELITSANGREIGNAIGNLIRVEDPIETGSLFKGFIRIRLALEITKPLLPGFWFLGKDNSKFWAELKFEKLENFCFSCGRLGHGNRTCKHKADKMNAKFGVDMRAPSYRYPASSPECSTFHEKGAIELTEPTQPRSPSNLVESNQSPPNGVNSNSGGSVDVLEDPVPSSSSPKDLTCSSKGLVSRESLSTDLKGLHLKQSKEYESQEMCVSKKHRQIRMNKEQEEKEDKRKYKAQAHLFTIIKVAREEDLAEQIGKDIYFDLVDHDKVRSFHIQKQTPFRVFKEEVAQEFGIPVQYQRFWIWSKRRNHTCRPHQPLTPLEEAQPVGQLRKVSNKAHNAELKLFLEVEHGPDLHPIPLPHRTMEDILLFFKLYDPEKGELRYVGRLFVKLYGKPIDYIAKLNKMAGFGPDEEIELYEEIKVEPSVMCDHLDKRCSFKSSEIGDGDIICFQKYSIETAEACQYPNVPSFLEYVHKRQQEDKEILVKHSDVVERPQPIEVAQHGHTPSVKFTWTIENFSSLNMKKLYSDIFVADNYKWRILIFPKGNNVEQLSMYLDVADSPNLPYGWSRYTQFRLTVVNKIQPQSSITKVTQHEFHEEESDWGFTSFMPLTDLHDITLGYLVNDTLVVEAEVGVGLFILNRVNV